MNIRLRMLNKNLITFVCMLLIFRVLLEVSYVNVVTSFYSYEGYHLNFELLNYFVSWLFFLMGTVLIKDRVKSVSDYFFVVAFVSVVTPVTILYGYDSERSLFTLVTVLAAFFLIYFVVRIKLVSFKSLPVFKNGLKLVVIICSLFVLFLIIWFLISGVKFNLDFMKVYEFRSDNAAISQMGVLAYTNNWTYQIFNIFLFTIALLYRKYLLVVLLFCIQVYFYSASAHKSVFFLPFLVLGIWLYFRKTNSLVIVPLALNMIIAFTLILYYFFGDLLASSIFSRRLFFVPANLTYVYFDFFSKNPHVFWSNSVLSSFLSYPYDLSMSHVIGRYLGHESMSANNGFIASGYAHAGVFGVLFYSLIIGLILRFINDISHNLLPLWVVLSLSIVPLRSLLISSDLFTVMLTHGFIVALIIILFVRSKKYAQY